MKTQCEPDQDYVRPIKHFPQIAREKFEQTKPTAVVSLFKLTSLFREPLEVTMCSATTQRVMNLGQAIMRGSNLHNVRISCCPSLAHVKCLPCVMSHCICAISHLAPLYSGGTCAGLRNTTFPAKQRAGKYRQANTDGV